MNSTHHVYRGPESLPCYCAATSDHLMGEEAMSPGEKLARLFHETYERLAPSFGYETRTETRKFDPNTPNGRLMIAVCAELSERHGAGDADRSAELTTAWMAGAESVRERDAEDAARWRAWRELDEHAAADIAWRNAGAERDAAIDAARAGERG